MLESLPCKPGGSEAPPRGEAGTLRAHRAPPLTCEEGGAVTWGGPSQQGLVCPPSHMLLPMDTAGSTGPQVRGKKEDGRREIPPDCPLTGKAAQGTSASCSCLLGGGDWALCLPPQTCSTPPPLQCGLEGGLSQSTGAGRAPAVCPHCSRHTPSPRPGGSQLPAVAGLGISPPGNLPGP